MTRRAGFQAQASIPATLPCDVAITRPSQGKYNRRYYRGLRRLNIAKVC